jgi:lysophospholipase L1-like esterase
LYLLQEFPGRDYGIIDVGLPSETVSGLSEPGHAGGAFPRPDLHERLDRVLQKLKPDLVIACYGMNDGIYYPFAQERFAAFTNGIHRLRERVLASGAQIIHLTPPTFDPVPIKANTLPAGLKEYRKPYEGYDDVLARYSEWLLAQRKNGWQVIDVHGPMKRELLEKRKQDPSFKFAGDGVHANEAGHWLITQQILKAWHLPVRNLDRKLLPAVHERQKMLTDAWLTEIGHSRPGMKRGLPIEEATRRAQTMKNELRKEVTGPAAERSDKATDK